MRDEAKRDTATQHQVQAADPTASTWLAANAGSGKTRVLTDRVARLLLAGTAPQNVLCLTYTKAAASEMQNRLFRRLGEWSMAPDAALAHTLEVLGADAPRDAATLARARRLFARAIETPGGLKIQTIHAFCASILRRFPLEAGISPAFRELDEAEAAQLRAEVLSQIAEASQAEVEAVAAEVSDEDFGPLCDDILRHRAAFDPPLDAAGALAAFGLAPGSTVDALRADAVSAIGPDDLRAIADVFDGESKTMQALAPELRRIAGAGGGAAAFDDLCAVALVADRSRANSKIPTKNARIALGPLAETWDSMAEAIVAACEGERALAAARQTHALHRFAALFLPAYERAKAERGLVDFDDLIARTARLLDAPGVAEWVLYKLDGGIEHILVDEAQDTAPEQWRIVQLLTADFTSGASAHAPGDRTLFVVGDLKQSIYSFQGADPDSFIAERDRYRARLSATGQTLQELELAHSFRSAPEILRAVDETFAPGNRDGLGDYFEHIPFHGNAPGRVELWPRVEPADTGEDAPWYEPVDQRGEEHHHARLAAQVAEAARAMVDRAHLPGTDGPRPVTAGDILILVQSRGTLFHEIIRRCKAAGLDVAGADVLKLGEELAVRDVTALLAFLDTPEDSLSLAAALRSPLFGWSEGDLYDLAAGRQSRHLWQALRRRASDWPETVATLDDLRSAADFHRPFELIERILTRHDGRRRLVARLGPEAADGIDALLARALAHEGQAVPSLAAFLAAQEGEAARIKRQAEGRGAKLRVMTVHGAKGLESPIVILPDCGQQRRLRDVSDRVLVDAAGRPLWSARKAEAPRPLLELREQAVARREAESRRLLYVAMTRAETWLVLAASGELGARGDTWYEQARAGLERAGAVADDTRGAGGLLLQSQDWPAEGPHAPAAAATPPPALPGWARTAPPAPPRPARPRAPSDLGGAKALLHHLGPNTPGGGAAGDGGQRPPAHGALPAHGAPPAHGALPANGESRAPAGDAAVARGTRLHRLLEELPRHDPATWPAIAAALDPHAEGAEDELAEAAAILGDPGLAPLFTPGTLAEVPITASLPQLGGQRIAGSIDRLVVEGARVLAVDFKSNTLIPERPEDIPEGLLRQMGAYAAALGLIYPGHEIETALLWTRAPRLMTVPPALAAAALARAAPSS
ncbi:double-strand break repair helicase AddA [Rhodovulum sp. 12E13]|uniref:double-strand break repair helicase AddA n=1 Tax=Rhodovulum sp. 12E13 TaxID=2203891 RepID=UPI000E146995|nr:double-strand break repair helicase AddA [Rhodovulum sp. 12E13]RDC73963.1 double-strand break repair helicase AddA [Rhodovulum sp. 12E13]